MSAATFEVPREMKVTVIDHAKSYNIIAFRAKPTKSAKPVPIVVNGMQQQCFAREGGNRPVMGDFEGDPGSTERYAAHTYFRWQGQWYCIPDWNARNSMHPRIEV